MLILAVAIAAPAGAATAQTRRGVSTHRAPHVAHHPPRNARERDHARFGHAGTRGREGLGADPRRPEGPGRVQLR